MLDGWATQSMALLETPGPKNSNVYMCHYYSHLDYPLLLDA